MFHVLAGEQRKLVLREKPWSRRTERSTDKLLVLDHSGSPAIFLCWVWLLTFSYENAGVSSICHSLICNPDITVYNAGLVLIHKDYVCKRTTDVTTKEITFINSEAEL